MGTREQGKRERIEGECEREREGTGETAVFSQVTIAPLSSWGILIRERELIFVSRARRKRRKATCSPSLQSIHHIHGERRERDEREGERDEREREREKAIETCLPRLSAYYLLYLAIPLCLPAFLPSRSSCLSLLSLSVPLESRNWNRREGGSRPTLLRRSEVACCCCRRCYAQRHPPLNEGCVLILGDRPVRAPSIRDRDR